MDWASRCAVVIPCLNEAAKIGAVVREAGRYLPRILVVDDGSTDGTAQAAAESGATVVRHERNLGKGAALAAGWGQARREGFSWALCMDGDGQHAAADIPKFLERAQTGESRLIVGNRMAAPAGMPWLRREVNQWMSRRLSRKAGRALPDSQCGFRMMDLGAWSGLRLHTMHFEMESEMLLAFIAAGHEVEFVPVQVIYNRSRSKIRPLRDTWRWFRWWRGA